MSDYKNVSFALFEEDDSSFIANGLGGYEFIPDSVNCGDGYLVVGYDFNRSNARLYINIKDGTGAVQALPFHPNYSYALLNPVDDFALQVGDELNAVYFVDGMPIASTSNLGGPDSTEAYFTPIYLKDGYFTTCAGTTVTDKEQIFSGNKIFNNNITIKGSTLLESTLDVADYAYFDNQIEVALAATFSDAIEVGGTATFKNRIELTGNSAATSQIHFTRTSVNYFTSATNGLFAFIANGDTTELASADLVISNNEVYPGTDEVTLGTSDNKWVSVYANTFFGDLSGNALTANKLNSNDGSESVPVYFSNGVPVACTPSKLFSNFSRSNRTSTINTLKTTVAGQERTFDLEGATASYAGLLTAADQTIAGAKTFNNNVNLEGQTSFKNIMILDSHSYGPELPSSGVEGQVFFLLID